jgi:hypothetical protein
MVLFVLISLSMAQVAEKFYRSLIKSIFCDIRYKLPRIYNGVQMYEESISPGQAFSFCEAVRVATFHGNGVFTSNGRVLMPAPSAGGSPTFVISPSERLIAQESVEKDGVSGRLIVPAWYKGYAMVFDQCLGSDAVEELFFASMGPFEQRGALCVENVTWPEPTPESLMVQVKVLGTWSNPKKPWRGNRYSRSIAWRDCEQLSKMPLEDGLPLALDMLARGKYVEDPKAALRERGFNV